MIFDIHPDKLTHPKTRALLALHLAGMRAHSPPGSVFALDLSGLEAPEVRCWSAWRGGDIAGIAALRQFDEDAAEIKSMRTHPDFLRMGVAAALLDHLIAQARLAGISRLSLETGSGPAFEPAIALYRRRGFSPGGAFSDYEPSTFNQFMHLNL